MNLIDRDHRRGKGHALLNGALILFLAAVAVLWAWNGAGVSLFQLPHAKFSEVAAILIAVAVTGVFLKVLFGGRRTEK